MTDDEQGSTMIGISPSPILTNPSLCFCMAIPRTFIVVLVLAITGCLEPAEVDTSTAAEPEVLYFETVGIGQSGRLADTTEVVLRSADEWHVMRDSLRSVEPFRPVDFSQTMLLLAALPQSSGGYRIQFESVEAVADQIVASYVVYAPAPDCLTLMALTLPYQVVAVRRAAGRVSFRRRIELESCSAD